MSTLERRYCWLLRAYPASYREERGDEILATLLEASADGQSWPSLRDSRALIVGGLRARAAQRRRLSAAANIRLALLLGVVMYLSLAAANHLAAFVYAQLTSNAPGTNRLLGPAGWLAPVTGLLIVAAVVLAWLSRRAVAATAALAGSAAIADYWNSWRFAVGFVGCQLLGLAALAVLARRAARPAPSWLWLIGLIVAARVVPYVGLRYGLAFGYELLLVSVLIISIGWVAVDARPAVGLATCLALLTLQFSVDAWWIGAGFWVSYPVIIAAAVTLAPALWRLRRQSVRAVQ
ncbi:MAG: hypothetical protein ACLQFR_30540 [Streptosporangiaceae bacterium]